MYRQDGAMRLGAALTPCEAAMCVGTGMLLTRNKQGKLIGVI